MAETPFAKNFSQSLHLRLAVLAGAILLVIPLLLALLESWHRSEYIDRLTGEVKKLAHEINYHGLEGLEHCRRISITLAATDVVVAAAAGTIPADSDEVLRTLQTARAISCSAVVFLMDQQGTVVACTPYGDNQTLTGNNYSFRPYFSEAIQGRPSIYPALGVTTKRRGLYFSAPVRPDPGQPPQAVVVIKGDLGPLETLFASYDHPVALLSPEGVVFASNRPQWLFHILSDKAPGDLVKLKATRQFADQEITPLPFAAADNHITLDGSRYIAIRQPINIPGWQLLCLRKDSASYPVAMALAVVFIAVLVAVLTGLNLITREHRRALTEKIEQRNEELSSANQLLRREICERRRGEKKISAQNRFLNTLLEALTFPFYVIDVATHRIELANTAAMAGAPATATTCHALTHGSDTPCSGSDHLCPLQEMRQTGRAIACEHLHRAADGSIRNVAVHGFPIHDHAGRLTRAIEFCLDITEQRQVEKALRESEERLKTILDSIQAGVILVDVATHSIIDVNPAALRMIGAERDDIVGAVCHRFICPAGVGHCPITDLGQKIDESERRLLTADGRELPIIKTAVPVTLAGRNCLLESFIDVTTLKETEKELQRYQEHLEVLVGQRTDELSQAIQQLRREIGERERAEERLTASLREKEALLSEVHHRVKNNMQVISSLLKLQSYYIKDKAAVAALNEARNRIKAMSLVHEKLYRSEDIGTINLNRYIRELTASLYRFYNIAKERIEIAISVADVNLDLGTAIPCGLIINELVANALKHAFPDNRPGRISIRLTPLDSGELELTIHDNGIGLPDDFDLGSADTLGLHLVSILAEDQLQGRLVADSDDGASFRIIFRGGQQ